MPSHWQLFSLIQQETWGDLLKAIKISEIIVSLFSDAYNQQDIFLKKKKTKCELGDPNEKY